MGPKRIIIPVGVLIGLGCLLVAFLEPDAGNYRFFTVGLIFGTLFGQTSLSAAWSAFGPLPLVGRLPLALVWLMALIGAFFANVTRHPGPSGFIVVLTAALFIQWLIVQAMLWCLAIFYGWRLRFPELGSAPQSRERQFGIGQLMIVTAIIAVLLGIGRMAVLNLPSDLNIGPDGPVLVFLGVTAILMTVPLIVGALLPRWAIAASAILLVIIGVATAWEFPLLVRVQSGAPPEVAWLFFVINYVAAGWILIFALAARICGYSVARSSVSKPAESIES